MFQYDYHTELLFGFLDTLITSFTHHISETSNLMFPVLLFTSRHLGSLVDSITKSSERKVVYVSKRGRFMKTKIMDKVGRK